jgi:gluconolactonase
MTFDASPILVAEGFGFPEGPSFDGDGNLFVMECDAGRISRVTQDGHVEIFAETGGVPCGSRLHRNGHLIVAENGMAKILDFAPDGSWSVIAEEFNGKKFRGPNDLILDKQGNCYFTDPKGSTLEKPIGRVFRVGADGAISVFAVGLAFPNGICLSEDEGTLYVAETFTRRIHAFTLNADGSANNRSLFAQMEGGVGPDGMDLGADGNLYVAHYGKGVVAVIGPNGKMVAELPVPGKNPTNVAFRDESLYVTETQTGAIYRLDIGVEGQPLYGLR